MAENDGWEPIHPAAVDDGWEPIGSTATAPIGEAPPDFGAAQVKPGEVTAGGAKLGQSVLDAGKQVGNFGLWLPNEIASGIGAIGIGVTTGSLTQAADVARDWSAPPFGEATTKLGQGVNLPFEKYGELAQGIREHAEDAGHPALGAIAETAANILPLAIGHAAGVRAGLGDSMAGESAPALKASEQVTASAAPPTAADQLKALTDSVAEAIKRNTESPPAPAPAIPAAPVTQGQRAAPIQPEAANGKPVPVGDVGNVGGRGTAPDNAASPAAPEAAARAATVAERPDATPALPAGTPVDASQSVPLAGGVSHESTGPQVVIDKRVPQFVTVEDRNGKPVQIDAHEAISAHERTEHPIMHEDGADYPAAHDTATEAENAFVANKYNVDPAKYQAALADAIEQARTAGEGDIPAKLDTKPYTDGGDKELLQQSTAPIDPATISQADWNKLTPPEKRTMESNWQAAQEAAMTPEQRANVARMAGRESVPDTATAAPDRMQELRTARDAGTATPEQLTELTHLQDTAAHTADVGGQLIPGVLNARGRTQLEASGSMKPVRVKTDLDDFKTINDTLGHDVGDEALRLKAEAMREAFGEGNVWREGGDEFGAHADTEEAAHAAMQKVRDSLSDVVLRGVDDKGNPIQERPIGVSYGLGRGKTHTEAAKVADNALRADKDARKAAGLRVGERRSVDAGMDRRSEGERRGQVPSGAQGEEVAVAEREHSNREHGNDLDHGNNEPDSVGESVASPLGRESDTSGPTDESVVSDSGSQETQGTQGTQVRNAAVDEQRDKLGLSELPPAEREHWQDASNKAAAGIVSGDVRPRALAAEVAAKPRALTTTETMALAHDLKALSDEHANATSDALAARERGDTVGQTQALLRQSAAVDAMETNHAALRNGGTEAARSLSIRNAILKDDYTVGRNMDRARLAFGDKFNDALKTQVEDLSAQLKAAQDRAAKLESEANARAEAAKARKAADNMTPDEKAQAAIQKQLDRLEKTIADRLKACPI